MKIYIQIIWIMVFPIVLQGQYTWERHTISATGGQQNTSTLTALSSVQHYDAKSISNSTYTGNTGFLVPQTVHLDIVLDVKVFLEGPSIGTNMNTKLNDANLIPLQQPYNTSPWNYSGLESVVSIPASVVDWVLIELRDAPNAASATPATMIEQRAAFLLDDGSIVDLDGTSILSFNHSLNHSLFIVVHHRNHLNIMSANALTKSDGIYAYDFTTDIMKAFNSGEKLVNGKAVMFGGDANADGSINTTDILVWENEVGKGGYLDSDANLNGQSDNQDKNDLWLPNNGVMENIPE